MVRVSAWSEAVARSLVAARRGRPKLGMSGGIDRHDDAVEHRFPGGMLGGHRG